MPNELKSCPFCGCDEIEAISKYDVDGSFDGVYLYCTECLVEQGVLYDTEREAIAVWNARVGNG